MIGIVIAIEFVGLLATLGIKKSCFCQAFEIIPFVQYGSAAPIFCTNLISNSIIFGGSRRTIWEEGSGLSPGIIILIAGDASGNILDFRDVSVIVEGNQSLCTIGEMTYE